MIPFDLGGLLFWSALFLFVSGVEPLRGVVADLIPRGPRPRTDP